MRIAELEPYIRGQMFMQDASTPYRASETRFNEWMAIMSKNEFASRLIALTESPKQFFELEPDIAEQIPKREREEMFFAVKNGFASPCVPAKCIYLVKKAYDTYGISNLILKQIPENMYKVLFSRHYLGGGYTMRDVIRMFCNQSYEPVSAHAPFCIMKEYSEIYIPSTDMVAAVPNQIALKLSVSDIQRLQVDDFGIHLDGTYLAFMEGYNGACNSIYDLRRLV